MFNENNTDPFVHLVTCADVEGDAKKIFESIEKSSGSVPKWMRVMGNSQEIFVNFFRLFNSTMGEGTIDPVLKWKISYKVSELNKCDFCVSVTKMKLKSFGLSDEEIMRIDHAEDEVEKLVLAYAEASTEHAYKIKDSIKNKLKENFTDEQIVELTATVGLFNFINRFNDALDVLPG